LSGQEQRKETEFAEPLDQVRWQATLAVDLVLQARDGRAE
jgi:hypothetical protein